MSNPTEVINSQAQVTENTEYIYQNDSTPPSAMFKTRHVSYKDSISHPINVSWIIPTWINALLQEDMSVPDRQFLIPFARREAEVLQKMIGVEDALTRAKKMYPDWRPRGNLGLSSCPGKKVRLDGPVNGRAKIVRDLDMDFDRLQKLGFTRVVCCLFDEELELLGSPFPKYLKAANSHGLDVLRIPMVEGSTPYSFVEMDRILDKMDETARNGGSILVHCRGGVGRAAVVACCWLLRLGYFKDHCEVIDWVRAQRSPKAIETKEQAQFVAGYQLWIQGGESRESSKLYETEIKRRIDWTESNVAHARELAAAMNEHGHHHRPHQRQHEQHIVHHPPHTLRRPFAHSQTSNASISSTATVSSRQAVPVSPSSLSGAQVHKQQHNSIETKTLAPGTTQASDTSISSTATVSSRQAVPVSPSSLSSAQIYKQQQNNIETKSLAPGTTQASIASIPSTAAVSSRQSVPVSPSSSLGKHTINDTNGADHH